MAAERWHMSQEEIVWNIPYVTLLYRFKSAERFIPKAKELEDTKDLPDITALGFEGLEIA